MSRLNEYLEVEPGQPGWREEGTKSINEFIKAYEALCKKHKVLIHKVAFGDDDTGYKVVDKQSDADIKDQIEELKLY